MLGPAPLPPSLYAGPPNNRSEIIVHLMADIDRSSTSAIQGVLIHESLPSGRAAATIRLQAGALHIQTQDGVAIQFPLYGIQLNWGGANNKLLFISHPNHPGWSAFTRDRALLLELRASGVAEVSNQVQRLQHHSQRAVRRSLVALLAILISLWGASFLWRPAIAKVADVIPISWEKKLGEAVFIGVQGQSRIIPDPELKAEFTKLLEPLVAVTGDRKGDFEFYIAQSDDLNAFALPGGKIVVHSRTILEADRIEELYGVLAHEISHVTLRHTTRQIITVFGIYTVADLVLGNVLGTVAAVTQGAAYLLQQGFSREQEREADVQGLAYLDAAQIDPRGMVEFFKRVEAEHAKNTTLSEVEKSLSFLSTHPETTERISELSQLISSREESSYRSVNAKEFEAFKAKLRSLVN